MKKRLLACLWILTLLLSACHREAAPEMYIEPAQLSAEEQALGDLLGMDSSHRIFDFQLDEGVQSIQVTSYELIDGQWAHMGGGTHAFHDTSGRLALGFDRLDEGLRVAIQSEHSGGATSSLREIPSSNESEMGITTSTLAQRSPVTYEEEIPLAIQIVTSQNTVHSYIVDFFFEPEEYAKYGYEHVYAVTIRFLQTELQ